MDSFDKRMRILSRTTLTTLAIVALCASAASLAEPPTPGAEPVSIRSAAPFGQPTVAPMPMADHVLVRKGERRLYLMHGETVLRSYRVALGLNPTGQKERAGDSRTPEGKYYLTRRNPRSDYFLSIQVSYPNDEDLRRARRKRWNTGGSIMVHGLPNQLSRTPQYYERTDWTDGCIAVSNADMLEIWLMTSANAPIEIRP
jgi:murein L,D-transpeptidase YafK